MTPGPSSKPNSIKRLEGNPGGRPLPEAEPQLAAEAPRAPKWIREDSQSHNLWRSLVRQLEPMRVLTKSDQTALAALTEALRDWLEARREIRKSGLLMQYTSDRGSKSIVRNPAVAIRNEAWKRLTKQLGRFGLDPSSRADVEALPERADADGFEKFLARRDH